MSDAPKTAIAGILLVPGEGSDLLAGGVGGSRPPMVRPLWTADGTCRWGNARRDDEVWGTGRALPLAWGGKVLAVGCFWWDQAGVVAVAVSLTLSGDPEALAALHRWAADKGHTLLIVDSDGRTIDTDATPDTDGDTP